MPGVHAVVKVAGGVAVVAESFHHAFKARDALRITCGRGRWRRCPTPSSGSRLRAAVPSVGAPPRGSAQVEGEFEFAFVSHAPMEVLTAVADVRADRAEIWFSSQTPMDVRRASPRRSGCRSRRSASMSCAAAARSAGG